MVVSRDRACWKEVICYSTLVQLQLDIFPGAGTLEQMRLKVPTLFTRLPGLGVSKPSWVTNLAYDQIDEIHENKLLGVSSPITD